MPAPRIPFFSPETTAIFDIGVAAYSFLGFCCGSAGKESACNAGDLGSIPGLGRSPGEGKGYPLQYSGLENSMDCVVHGREESGHPCYAFSHPDISCLARQQSAALARVPLLGS